MILMRLIKDDLLIKANKSTVYNFIKNTNNWLKIFPLIKKINKEKDKIRLFYNLMGLKLKGEANFIKKNLNQYLEINIKMIIKLNWNLSLNKQSNQTKLISIVKLEQPKGILKALKIDFEQKHKEILQMIKQSIEAIK